MRTKLLCLILFVTALIPGCKSANGYSSLESKAAQMSPELLRSQVLRYKALIEKDYSKERIAALAEIFNTLAPKDVPYTANTAKSISEALKRNPELNQWNLDYQENLKNYKFFYKKLQEKGGDMRGLELNPLYDREDLFKYEQLLPPNQDYQKPGSPPIEEKNNPYSESQMKKPA